MTDSLPSNTIVAALRRNAGQIPEGQLERDAADEIERLSQDLARYRSSHDVNNIVIETHKDKIKELEKKLLDAQQLAMRQGNEIRKLRGERA